MNFHQKILMSYFVLLQGQHQFPIIFLSGLAKESQLKFKIRFAFLCPLVMHEYGYPIHPSLSIILKENMLKGLKKSKPASTIKQDEDHTSRVRSSLNENAIKTQQIDEELQQPNAASIFQEQQAANEKEGFELCLSLFLNGNPLQLEEELAKLKVSQMKQAHPPGPQAPARGKFDYNMTFDGSEDAKQLKKEIKKRNRPIMASNRVQDYCMFCPDNQDLFLLSASNYVYLALPKHKTFDGLFHLILAPVDHEQTSIGLNEDTLTELNNYRKCLIQAFDKYNLQVVFFEQFSRDNSHIYIQCLAMPRARAEDLPFFFKQALEDIEGNWATHKSIIRIEKQKGGLQKQIPKQMKYFYIDFANGQGYAHVIENERLWKREFCNEVMATALNLQMHRVKTTQTYSPEENEKKKEVFEKIWKPFDWTQLI